MFLSPAAIIILGMEQTTQTTLQVSDRCDVCGAQAYIRVELELGELLFCAHHGNANKEKLAPIMTAWHDQSEELTRR